MAAGAFCVLRRSAHRSRREQKRQNLTNLCYPDLKRGCPQTVFLIVHHRKIDLRHHLLDVKNCSKLLRICL